MYLERMHYRVLARKYRPRTFDEIVGQPHVVRTLKNAIPTGRIPHAFLFVGPRGIGKTSTARILAKALNCPGGPKVDFDPEDPVCVEIAEGRAMDVIEIDGASNNSVDHIRELRDSVSYAPARGPFKIYIIDEVHMLSASAFNALLKTLEEPPAHVKFIFATTEAQKVLPTILSRCQRFDLKRISETDIARHLGQIAKLEKINAEPEALRVIARLADGGMRDAESSLEQLLGFCGQKITARDVRSIFSLASWEEIDQLARAILAQDATQTLELGRKMVESDQDILRILQELARYMRGLLLWNLSPAMARQEVEEEKLEKMATLQPQPSRSLCLALIEELLQAESRLRHTLVKEALFEVTLLRLLEQKEKVSIEEVLTLLGTDSGGEIKSAQISTQPSARPPIQSQTESHARPSSPPTSLTSSSPLETKKTSSNSYSAKIETEESLPTTPLNPVSPASSASTSKASTASSNAAPSNGASASTASFDKTTFLNDPLIAAALKAFEARLVEIRPGL